jgi:hypothetical protein
VREPYSLINSLFQQRLRSGETFDQIIADPPRPKYQRIDFFIRAFGRENVDIRLFDPARFVGGDLLADLFAAIGAAPELARELEIVRANEAISHEAAYLINAANGRLPFGERRSRNPGRAVDLADWLASVPGQPFQCPHAVFTAARPIVEEELRWLRDTMAEPVFPGAPRDYDIVPQWSDATLSAVAVLINDLARRANRGAAPPRAEVPIIGALSRQFGKLSP